MRRHCSGCIRKWNGRMLSLIKYTLAALVVLFIITNLTLVKKCGAFSESNCSYRVAIQ